MVRRQFIDWYCVRLSLLQFTLKSHGYGYGFKCSSGAVLRSHICSAKALPLRAVARAGGGPGVTASAKTDGDAIRTRRRKSHDVISYFVHLSTVHRATLQGSLCEYGISVFSRLSERRFRVCLLA